MNFYAEQLRHIADYLDALNRQEQDGKVSLKSPAPILMFEDAVGEPFGEFVDEVGGVWSWRPTN